MAVIYRCPECGSSEGLYARTDVRWDPAAGEWVTCWDGFEEGIDCTNCDHVGPIATFEQEEL